MLPVSRPPAGFEVADCCLPTTELCGDCDDAMLETFRHDDDITRVEIRRAASAT